MSWIEANWGNVVSAVGLAVSIAGFAFAIVQIIRTRKVATAAKDAAESTRNALSRNLTIADLTRASERIEELKELHRSGEWRHVLDRYTAVRRLLVEIVTQHQDLSERPRGTLRTVIRLIEEMEGVAESALRDQDTPDMSDYNLIRSNAQSVLAEASIELQQSL